MQTIKHTLNKKERGFTLIELLVVIAIIAVLAALILAALSSAQKGSRDSRRQSDLNQYKTALAQYSGDSNGNYPGSTTQASAVTALAALTPTYMSQLPDDPKTAGSYRYITDASPGTNYGICVTLERDTASMFAVGPTYSGKKTNAATCVVQG